MSHLYVFCAAAGAVAYGVGVAVGMWAQKRRMMEGIEGTEITLDQFRRLVKENEALEREARLAQASVYMANNAWFDALKNLDETRKQLIITHDNMMMAFRDAERFGHMITPTNVEVNITNDAV